jgi:hypothetical protein
MCVFVHVILFVLPFLPLLKLKSGHSFSNFVTGAKDVLLWSVEATLTNGLRRTSQ